MMDEIIKKCQELKLEAIITHIEAANKYAAEKNWSHLKILLYLLNLEAERRRQGRIELRYKQSKLNQKITIDQFDFVYHKSRKSHKNVILNLTESEFIK